MHETHDQPRSVLIAAVFCAIIGLITYAGYLQRGWALSPVTIDIHQATMATQKAKTDPRQAQPDDSLRAILTIKDPAKQDDPSRFWP